MFMCNQCEDQHDDQDLAYTVILESRVTHPAADMFVLKFCSKQHVQDFLARIGNQRQRYILTKKGKTSDRQFEPGFPLDLLLLVGSNMAS